MSFPHLDIQTLKQLPKLVAHYRRPNFKKAALQMLTSFGPFLAVLVVMYSIAYYNFLPYWTLAPLAIINALFLVRIFIIQHDCGHQSFTPSQYRNDAIGKISSLFSIIPYTYRAKGHNFHHNHTNKLREHRDIGEIMTYTVEEYKNLSPLGKFWYRVFRSAPVMFGLIPTWYVLIQSRFPTISLEWWTKERGSLLISNILIFGFYTSLILLLGWKVFLLTHVPILFSFATIAIRFFYIQHQYEFSYKSFEDRREYVRAAVEGSSFYDLPKIRHRLTGNIWYHHIHHLNASIPSYELARCFKENKILQDVARRLTFTQSLSCIRRHLRDEHQQKMISFREYYRRYGQK
jgi:omega-6 fatty acid desaturase (delta-12 desaturase)